MEHLIWREGARIGPGGLATLAEWMSTTNNKPSNQTGPTRVLIVDDHPLVRLSLREFIRREKDLVVCGEAEDREQALVAVGELKPHLAIVDLTLKTSNGMELIKDLRERHPEVQILVLSMHDEAIHAERAIGAALHIDVSTVETYRARIKEKLNLKDSRDLLQYAIQWHITSAQG